MARGTKAATWARAGLAACVHGRAVHARQRPRAPKHRPARIFARVWKRRHWHSRTTPSSVGNTPARWGTGGPGATFAAPHNWGTSFTSCRPVGTGDDHAQVADCWVVPLKERPPLRMGLKPVPPLRTVCMSSNGTRFPLDSRGLAAGARGGPFAVDFDLPRPRLSTSSWVFGADFRLITNEVAACRSQPPTSGDLAGYQPNPSAKG